MRIIDLDREAKPSFDRPLACALGHFDGLHRGHQRLIQRAVQLEEEGCLSAVLLFKNPPAEAIGGQPQPQLTSLEDKEGLLEEMGVDVVAVKAFDPAFMALSKEDFLRFLINQLQLSYAVVGYNYSFGWQGRGNYHDLLQAQQEGRLKLALEDYVMEGGRPVSSSRIRQALKEGRPEEARVMLGRPYRLHGQVVEGARRGRQLGFPTLNLRPSFSYLIPRRGVYLSQVILDSKSYFGMTNVGFNPTFNDKQADSIETYLFQYKGNAYGKEVQLSFLRYEREDVRFTSAVELKKQLEKDQLILQEWAREEEKG